MAQSQQPVLEQGQLGLQQVVHVFGVGFALARFHHLTDQGVEGLVFASFDLRDVVRIGGDHLLNDAF